MKRRFINDEQLPFPEGYAVGVLLSELHESGRQDRSARFLLRSGGLAAGVEFLRSGLLAQWSKVCWLGLPAHWDAWIYGFWTPRILGTPLRELTIQLDSSLIMVATGGLLDAKTGRSLLLGALINYAVLAPSLISKGVIVGTGFKSITAWSLWGGAALMTASSLTALLSSGRSLWGSLGLPLGQPRDRTDVLKEIEVPPWVSILGIPVSGALIAWVGHAFFGIPYVTSCIAVPLTGAFTLVVVVATGATSFAPSGPMAKVTQLFYSCVRPGDPVSGIMASGINSEASFNAANLLMDIKPGYMLGAKPRQQAWGHVLGIFSGSFACSWAFDAIFSGDLSLLASERFPMPSAVVWKAIADALNHGLSALHPSALWALGIGAALGTAIELGNRLSKGRFPVSGIGLSIPFMLPFADSFALFVGSAFFTWLQRGSRSSRWRQDWFEQRQSICAGAITGGALLGLLLLVLQG